MLLYHGRLKLHVVRSSENLKKPDATSNPLNHELLPQLKGSVGGALPSLSPKLADCDAARKKDTHDRAERDHGVPKEG